MKPLNPCVGVHINSLPYLYLWCRRSVRFLHRNLSSHSARRAPHKPESVLFWLCFKFSNTTPLAHRIAADAIEAGLDFLPHNRTFFEQKSKVRFLIERKMFDDMIFSDNGEICCSWLDRSWLNEIGATDDDLDNLSTLTMSLEGVRCGIILTQNKKDKAYKVSVRSHRPADASRICANFGGGGHPRAAGCTVDMPAQEACCALMAAAAEELARW